MLNINVVTTNKEKIADYVYLHNNLVADGEVSFTIKDWPVEVEEDGISFISNAKKKAKSYAAYSGEICLADDSGSFIEALGGIPGITTRRWCQINKANFRDLVLSKLKNTIDRRATVATAIAIAFPDGETYTSEAKVTGTIAITCKRKDRTDHTGIFIPDGYGKVLAEIKPDDPKAYARAKAMYKLIEKLRRNDVI